MVVPWKSRDSHIYNNSTSAKWNTQNKMSWKTWIKSSGGYCCCSCWSSCFISLFLFVTTQKVKYFCKTEVYLETLGGSSCSSRVSTTEVTSVKTWSQTGVSNKDKTQVENTTWIPLTVLFKVQHSADINKYLSDCLFEALLRCMSVNRVQLKISTETWGRTLESDTLRQLVFVLPSPSPVSMY